MATPRTDFPPVRACLFDMDGLLINTEDILAVCHNTVLATYSAGPMTWSIKAQLQGRPAHEATDLLLAWANLSNIVTPEEYTKQLHIIQERQFPYAQPLPGVEKLLGVLKATQNGEKSNRIHIALATSSDERRFKIKTSHLEEIFKVFQPEKRILGDDVRIPKGRGKPCPDIYLLALKVINESLEEGEGKIRPEECLVFEDAIPGVVAGRRAGMRVIWCPHPDLAAEYRGREAEVLAGFAESGVGREFGMIGDGWVEQLVSLVDFSYDKYGIVSGE